ncbi:TBC1 domain family member 31 [Tribolium castaneum]|uniref:TBC1 domain family member 31 n=1 Tax=Tribolium castaneum TaxID=7070 RepID=D6WSD6_TRICA|nr:PREDICTED: TBC1 domain family member 31 [Tribolium castaneum]EFA06627.1 TBC1 domain family member 31-like Protein [Tribolium castaneum]|eukprot:XP_972029.1 PREDICTED: TBC1 domain family member 31 [Tribolium castaneum]
MTLNLTKENRIYKKLFTLKPSQRDGLVLNIHHTDRNAQKIRFLSCCFSKNGQTLALADYEGNIFVIDFTSTKFWNIPKFTNTCVMVKFSHFKEGEILVGAHCGAVYVVEAQTGFVCGQLRGHQSPVNCMTFGSNFLCLTGSTSEAILWDLNTNSKLQVLSLQHSCALKYVCFIPVSSYILTCFNDDVIQIWQFGTFEMKTEIPPLVWFNHEVKNITFTQDGKVMVIGCRSPHLALFLLSNFKLFKFITLPEHIQSLKHIDFIPQPNDAGSNKILAILSGRGTVYFYDSHQNVLMSELVANYEISKYDFSASYMACVLSSGDVNIYDVTQYVVVPLKLKAVRAESARKKVKLKRCLEKMGIVKEQIREILEIEKLRMILKECGEFPDSYRTKIWEHLLALPNNRELYNGIINHRMIVSFEDLCRKYPLENKRNLKNLKQLLDNLVTWCPFFLNVDYLPLFVFPFVKVFINKPLTCFEAVCTIILNWCQFWFEYFPLPPINILAMIENVLMVHDPELLDFLTRKKVSSELYAWPILRTAFSEVLTAPSWKIFWDHVLTNEPSFLLCGVVAYNILQRTSILSLKDDKQFRCFYKTHHPIDVKKLLTKSYHILAKTGEAVHPRQYLNMFKKINLGEYPNFCDYPKTMIEMSDKEAEMKREMAGLKTDEVDLFRRRLISLERLQNFEVEEEENKRILEMERAIRNQLLEEQTRVQEYYERVANLREKFHQEDKILASLRHQIAKEQQLKSRRKYLSSIMDDVRFRKGEKGYALTKTEDELLFHYAELLKNKYKIEKLLNTDEVVTSTKLSVDQQQEQLSNEINFVRSSEEPRKHLKMLNLTTGLEAMDALIEKVESELEKQKSGSDSDADRRVVALQAESKELALKIANLIELLANLRSEEVGG